MTITLTREEAQRMLSELEDEIPFYSENDCSTPEWITDAIELLRTRLSAPQPEYRDVVIKGDLWRIEFLPDHAASVVLVKANYEAQSEPKLVAYLRRKEFAFGYEQVDREDHGAIPVYTTPPQREWQGLTANEMMALFPRNNDVLEKRIADFALAIEAKLKEKNND
jgi:hypothetical protein